jgi:DNA-binding transcriptional ArsR family regulator
MYSASNVERGTRPKREAMNAVVERIHHPAASEIDMARVLRAAGDPVRLAIIRLLADEREYTCNEIQAELDLPSSTSSYHLRLLREAGLTRTRAQGTERRITLRRADLEQRFPGLLDALVQ